jgi:hypothetical protein
MRKGLALDLGFNEVDEKIFFNLNMEIAYTGNRLQNLKSATRTI